MSKPQFLATIILLCCGLVQLSAQQYSSKWKLKTYFFDSDVYREAHQLYLTGKIAESRHVYLQAIEQFEQQQNWEAYFVATKKLMLTYSTPEEYEQGIEIGTNTLKKFKHDKGEASHFCVHIYDGIAGIYRKLKRWDDAIAKSYKGLQFLNQHNNKTSDWEYVMLYHRIASVYQKSDDLENTNKYLSLAEKIILNRDETEAHPLKALTLESLSSINRHRGNINRAMAYAIKALDAAIAIYGNEAFELANYYYQLGSTLSALGELEQSTEYFKKGISLLEKERSDEFILYKSDYDLPYLYGRISDNYVELAQPDKALYFLKKSLEAMSDQLKNNPEKIYTLRNIGVVYIIKGELEKAMTYSKAADSLWYAAKFELQKDRYFYRFGKHIQWNFAAIWQARGDYEKVKSYYYKFLKLSENDANKNENTEVLLDLASLYIQEQKLDSALYFNQLALITSTNPSSSVLIDTLDYDYIPEVNTLSGDFYLYSILVQRARIFAASISKVNDASLQSHLQDKALAYIKLGDQFHQENLKKMNVQLRKQSQALAGFSLSNYQQGLSLAHQFYHTTNDPYLLHEGFSYTQKMKAQQLWLTLLNSEASSFGNVPASLLEQEQELLSNIQYYEKQILKARKHSDTAAIAHYENDYLFNHQVAYQKLVQKMEINYPDYYSSKYNFIPETEASLQQLLNEDELLIEYVLTDTALFIFTLAQNEPLQLIKIPLSPQMAEQIQGFHQLLQKSSWMRRSNREKFIKASHALYQQFLQPIEKQIAQHQRLIIIGDGMTNYIPFETLLASDEISPFKELDYLIRQHEVSYHYSASLFAKARKRKTAKNHGIYAFAPVYESTEIEPDDTAIVLEDDYAQLRAYREDGTFAPLPESEKEVQEIIQLFTQKGIDGNHLALRTAAHEAALKTELEKPYQFIHIAGHSFSDVEHPKFSGIACYEETFQDSTAQTEDGVLYTGEIYNISSQTDLVTLSSCESGYGQLDRSEGLLGLNRAFIYAGTPNVIFSLWKVYDKVNAKLMVDFYEAVLSGKSYATSLRQAKLKLLDQEITAAPHFWGPYLLIGR